MTAPAELTDRGHTKYICPQYDISYISPKPHKASPTHVLPQAATCINICRDYRDLSLGIPLQISLGHLSPHYADKDHSKETYRADQGHLLHVRSRPWRVFHAKIGGALASGRAELKSVVGLYDQHLASPVRARIVTR